MLTIVDLNILCTGAPYRHACIPIEVQYIGGDKPKAECKEHEDGEMVAYREALKDLVKAVSVAHLTGKNPDSF